MTNKNLQLNKTYTFDELCTEMDIEPIEGKRLTQLEKIRKYCKLKSQGFNTYKVIEIYTTEEEKRQKELKETIKDMPWITMADDGTLQFKSYYDMVLDGEIDADINDLF